MKCWSYKTKKNLCEVDLKKKERAQSGYNISKQEDTN
jgi:hypothetical protein